MTNKLFKHITPPVAYSVIISVLVFVLLDVFVRYTPVLRESIVGYAIVLFYLPLFAFAIALPLFVIYLIELLIKKRHISLYIIFTPIVSIIAFLYLFFGWHLSDVFPLPLPTGSDRRVFSKELWNENKQPIYPAISYRQEMLQDVVTRFPGKNRKEVIQLLGDKFSPFSFHYSSNADLKYYLGDSRTVSPGEEWLFIWFDEQGNFMKYEIVTFNA